MSLFFALARCILLCLFPKYASMNPNTRMVRTACISLCLLLVPLFSLAQDSEASPAESLRGQWIIDLRPTPDSEEYFQTFSISSVKENTLEGSFYGSSIENGLLNSKWDKLYFAFSTKDKSSSYYHSGYIFNGVLYGQTYCPKRSFTAPWTGTKKD